MPRVRRRSKRHADRYSEDDIMFLCHGYSLIGADRFCCPGRHGHDDDAIAEAWKLLGERLTEQWIQERPGSRPWGWWKLDAPERRRRIDGVVHPFDDKRRQDHVERIALEHRSFRDVAYRLHFGVPSCFIGGVDDSDAKYEGELAFLDRHDLLTPFERRELYGESDDATSETA